MGESVVVKLVLLKPTTSPLIPSWSVAFERTSTAPYILTIPRDVPVLVRSPVTHLHNHRTSQEAIISNKRSPHTFTTEGSRYYSLNLLVTERARAFTKPETRTKKSPSFYESGSTKKQFSESVHRPTNEGGPNQHQQGPRKHEKTRPRRSHLLVTYRRCYFQYSRKRVGENQYSRLARLKKTSRRQDKTANRQAGVRRGLKSSQHPPHPSHAPAPPAWVWQQSASGTNTTNYALVYQPTVGHVRATSSCH